MKTMFGLPKFGRGIGFRRMLDFCERHSLDLQTIGTRSVVVTGSNGKGSTARYAYHLLRTHYHRVGCFTSPHLFDVSERFELSGTTMPASRLKELIATVLRFNDGLTRSGDFLGAFELLFLVALQWFIETDAECVVWEAGIGGRYDPVRLLGSRLSALTSIDLEHTELLGPTKELIAFDKLDATRPGGLTIVSPSVEHELYERLRGFAAVSGKQLRFVAEVDDICDVAIRREGSAYTLRLEGEPARHIVDIPLGGLHQIYNSATAIALVRAHCVNRCEALDVPRAILGLADVHWPGRLELIDKELDVWVDVGHTPEGLEVTATAIKQMMPTADPVVVVGVSNGKALKEIVAVLERHFTKFIVTQAYKNGHSAEALAGMFTTGATVLHVSPTVERAVEMARIVAARGQQPVVVLGGLFLAVEFAHAWRGNDPKELDFF